MTSVERIGNAIVFLSETTSTMDEAAGRAAAGARHGLVVVARTQHAGQGRSGRQWVDEPGSALLFSILLRPPLSPERMPGFSLAAGLAVASAVDAIGGVACTLKWPNDLLIEGRKVGGMLTRARTRGSEIDYLILGVGINLREMSEHPNLGATSLETAGAGRIRADRALGPVLGSLDLAYRAFVGSAGRVDIEAWTRRAAFLGETVRVIDNGAEIEGRLVGVDAGGALLIDVQGTVRRVIAGDLTRGPVLAGATT